MAKWGQGDPRWIVEERTDGTNVNNWHWCEKNATEWSKQKFNDLMVGMKIENDAGDCKITELSKIEGEATVTNRRGKLGFFYDWVLSGSWEGKLSDGQKKIKGKFEIPNLGEEKEMDEIVMNVTIDKETDEARKVKDIMRIHGLKIIQQQAEKYLTALKEEYSKGVILPTKKADPVAQMTSSNKENVIKKEMNKVVEGSPSSSNSNDVGVRIPTTTITMRENFRCEASFLYRALTDKDMVKAYTGDSVVEAIPGGRFALMGGNIVGEYTELVPDSKMCMRWRMKSWPDEHYSTVTIELEQKGGETVLCMKQKGVPERQVDSTKGGWKVNLWERMKAVFGIGNNIL